MPTDPIHERLLAIVKTLPGAYEDHPWGSIHCKVAGKIFVGWGRREDGAMSIGFKTDKELQAMLVASDPRFTIAAYVGKHGWVDMRLDPEPAYREVEQFVVESYRMIAPKKLVKELDAARGGAAAPAPKAAKKAVGVKGAAAKKGAGAKAKRSAPAKRARAPRAG